MSVEAITVVLNHSKARGSEKLVLIGIANHHGDNGAWPSVETLTRYTNLSERRVQQTLVTLVELGELKVEKGGGAGIGKYRTNKYWITLKCPVDCEGFPSHSQPKPVSPDGSQPKPASLQDEARFALEVKPSADKPLRETLKEPLRQATFLPEDFMPSQKSIDEMVEHFPWVDLKKQTHSFRDYWNSQPTSKAKKTDWDATWRNWIRRSADYGKPKDEPTQTKHRFSMEEE